MPEGKDVALRIGGEGTTTIETPGGIDEIAFGFEGGAGVIQTGVEHGHPVLRVHAVPGDVSASVATDGELGSSNVADGHGRFFGIDLEGRGKCLAVVFGLAVDDASLFGGSGEVDEVEDSVAEDELGLQAAIGHAQGGDAGGGGRGSEHSDTQDEGCEGYPAVD